MIEPKLPNDFGRPMKTTTDQTKQIDIRYLRQQGLLKPGMTGQLFWSNRGRPTGDIRYQTHNEYLAIDYRYRVAGGSDWEPISQKICFDYTPCHFGGHRYWFICPQCSRRIAILYGNGRLFLCRHCHQLPYESQLIDDLSRLIDQKHKLGQRTFAFYEYGDGWGKPKGTHWKTFNRQQQKYNRLESTCDRLISEKLNGTHD